MAKFWKCYNCTDPKREGAPGRDFTADEPKCPNCGLDAADKAVAHLIVQCRVIHFEGPHPIAEHHGCGKIACGCSGAGKQVTRAIEAANCPACLASEAGVKALAARNATEEVPNPTDFAVRVDVENSQLAKV